MKYLFITGRNQELSIIEFLSYFEKNNIFVKKYTAQSNGVLVDLSKEINPKEVIKELGGIIGIGKVLTQGNFKETIKSINDMDLYFSQRKKLIYSFMSFLDDEQKSIDFLDEIKNKFRREKIKARYNGLGGEITDQKGETMRGTPSKLKSVDTIYFVFGDKECHFGIIDALYDSKDAEKRDMQKPVRREELSISPRLAKILINLSQVKENENILDPFCGVGIIIQEALLMNINAKGIDLDKEAIEGAKKNLDWLKKNYKISAFGELINNDSRKIQVRNADGIATEPELGKLLRKSPNKNEAKVMIKDFEKLLIDVLNNLKKSVKKDGKISFTTPFIKTAQGKVCCDIEEICQKTNLKVHQLKNTDITFPIEESREKSIVGRNFYVLVN